MMTYQDTIEKLKQTEKLLEESRNNFIQLCRSQNREHAKLENARIEIFELKKLLENEIKEHEMTKQTLKSLRSS